MTEGSWRTAYASVVGTSHARTKAPCQDAGACVVVRTADGGEVLVAAVADGAGTASRSEAGAALTVEMFLGKVGEAVHSDLGLRAIDRAFALRWLASVQEAVAELAARDGAQPRDYACTVLGAVVGPAGAAYLQIGDGAIVVSGEERGEYNWIFWPQHGEFANTTNFVTQESAEQVLLFECDGPAIDEIALFSDGIERLVLDWSARTVHSPSFRPIFDWLAGTAPGTPGGPSGPLAAYLGSDHVNQRTDDDKTLVMATRPRRPAGAP